MTEKQEGDARTDGRVKILLVINAFEDDAPTRVMLHVGEAAAASGLYECAVAAWSRGGPLRAYAEERVGRTYVLTSPNDGLGTTGPPIRRFFRVLRRLRPALVHFSLTRPTLLGVPVASALEVPRIVITQHGTHEWSESDFYPESLVRGGFFWISRAAHRLVTVSEATRYELVAAGAPLERVVVIPNGVDTEQFRPRSHEERAAVRIELVPSASENDVYLVGAAGNFRHIKGYDVFIAAAALLRARCPQARFVLWGSGPEEPALRQLVEKLRLADVLQFRGRVPTLATLLPALDVFVQPSRRESFGLATAEAMSCGVPVVVSAVGGLRELVSDGVHGFQVPQNDPETLARVLAFLFEHPDQQKAMGEAARSQIMDNFSVTAMRNRYLNLYEELLEGVPRYGEATCPSN